MYVVYACVYIYVYVCMYMRVYMYVYVYLSIDCESQELFLCMLAGVMDAHVCPCAYACVSICMYVYICAFFFCDECCVHFGTGVLGTSACVGMYVTQVFCDINVHICDTLAAGCAHMCMCIYVCMCMHMYRIRICVYDIA